MSQSRKIDIKEGFDRLFLEFRDMEGEFKYVNRIYRMVRDGQVSLVVDYPDLILMDNILESNLANKLIEVPDLVLTESAESLRDFVQSENPDYYAQNEGKQFFVRFSNLPNSIKIRDIRTKDVDEIYHLDGIIIRTTEIKSIMEKAEFICDEGHFTEIYLEYGRYETPNRCSDQMCKSKKFTLIPNPENMIDWQFVTLQEKPEDLPPGASPKSIPCRLVYDIVNLVRPGDRVNISGIIRSRETNMKKRGQVLTYDNWIEVNFIESTSKEDELTEITPEEEQEFLEMGRDPQIFDHLLNSLAPQIYGLEDVKKAALLMLFAGVDKSHPDGFTTRGQPNILLVGDPGVAKSQLLRYVQQIAPRGLYTSGKGSSAAGLTAAIIRDPETGEITLEAGAMVLADRGVCLIDEFDKMNENDRSAIHEAMEQHSYHPSVEVTFADGSVKEIGSLVDELFETENDRIVEGINCEILPLNGKLEVITTDFDTLREVVVDRISRHEAPDYFYRIEFDNGRSVIVTPEHPMYVYDQGLTTFDASQVAEGMFVPGPKSVSYRPQKMNLSTDNAPGNKSAKLPSVVTKGLAQFLGIMVAMGNTDSGLIEICTDNSSSQVQDYILTVIRTVFELEPIVGKTIKIDSKAVYNYLQTNFPDLMTSSSQKRIPRMVLTLDDSLRLEFVRSSLLRIGSSATSSIEFATDSVKLSHDYQDLLSTLGLQSVIKDQKDCHDKNHSGSRYIVTIAGQSLDYGDERIRQEGRRTGTLLPLQNLIELRGEGHCDLVPLQVIGLIKECLTSFDMVDDLAQLPEKYITAADVKRYVTKIRQRLTQLDHQKLSADLAYNSTLGQVMYGTILDQLHGVHTIRQIRQKIRYVEELTKFRWLTITSVTKIPNRGDYRTDWVYDVTIEPTRNFISHGVVLHNTVSVAKAGIVATLNARTGVLAAANPKYGRYEENRPFSENVNLSPAILSRFDLVFILRDVPETERDAVLASHILKLHRFHGSADSSRPPLDEERLKKFIAYAKRNYHPTITEEAAERIEAYYVTMRNSYGAAGDNAKDRVTITARQLEGIIRLAEARARAALKTEVTRSDAEFAINLMEASLSQIATDPETGTLDIDALYSGQTSSRRSRLTRLQEAIDFVYQDAGGEFDEEELIRTAVSEGLSEEYVTGAIRQMVRDGALYSPKRGKLDKP